MYAKVEIRQMKIEQIIALALSYDKVDRKNIARYSNTPIELLCYLSNDEDISVLKVVAENTNTPIHIIEKLSTNIEWEVRRAVANSKKIILTLLRRCLKIKSGQSERPLQKMPIL